MPIPALRTTPPAQVEAIISRRDCFLHRVRFLRHLLSHSFVLGCAGSQQQSHHQALSNGNHGAERLCVSTELRTQNALNMIRIQFQTGLGGWLPMHEPLLHHRRAKRSNKEFAHKPSRPSAVPFPPLAHALIAEPNDTSASTRSSGTKEI